MTDYHQEVLAKFPKGEWVKPTNNGSNDFSVFSDLHEWGFVERKIEVLYKGAQMVGSKVYFKY